MLFFEVSENQLTLKQPILLSLPLALTFLLFQACLEQEARVAELRSLAARVAAETGSRALQADADALARRLQLVAGAVQALADLGEARQLARAKAQHVKEQFSDMRQVSI